MARRGGWRRKGRKGDFRYYDARGKEITDPDKIARIQELVIPPAWKDVWISSRATAKLQATGIDRAGRRQYLYHPDYRARQEQEKFDKLIRFAEKLPDLRKAMAKDLQGDPLSREWACALALRLINIGWFRVGTERYARTTRSFGITTLRKGHVSIRGSRISFKYRGKHRVLVRTAVVDAELAAAMRELTKLPGGRRLFRYESTDGSLRNLTGAHLNAYIEEHMGGEFTAKDFRTWGGTLIAAIAFAEQGTPETETAAKKVVAGVMRAVGARLGNTPAVARASYVSPAVVEQYLDGRTIDDFRPRHLRVVGARDTKLDREELALVSLLRSWRIRRARLAA
jgi:DNA topoisomerase I